MVLAQAIVADIVTPRQRGRYQGYIGSVYALSSIVGPLLGGFFVDHLSWRWAFYVNLPLGLIALVVTQRALKLTHQPRPHRIDYAGAATLTIGISTLLLVTVWGGDRYAWTSPELLTLAGVSLLALVVFVLVQRRASEPILPLGLFRERTFTVGNLIGFVVGAVMFGAVIFMPLFLQVVVGVSATHSGMLLLPLMLGMLSSSIASGRLISHHGRYKVFPVTGTAVTTLGFLLLATMDRDTSFARAALAMLVVGAGLGMVLQVVVLAIQNAVSMRHLGAATSGAQLFRSIGGTIGVTAFGAIMNARLDLALGDSGVTLTGDPKSLLRTPAAIAKLPQETQNVLRGALADSITFVFATAIPLCVLAFLVALLLKEQPLRDYHHSASGE
jgi:MFS family permease